MPATIFLMRIAHLSPSCLDAFVEHRRLTGAGRLDECWEGVWHLTDPSARHQRWAGKIFVVHTEVVEGGGLGTAWISINVTDREEGWIDNHRCPDGAVLLNSNRGRWIGEDRVAFLGGTDMVVEVLSKEDDTYLKLPFYAERGVREILILDPATGRPELWRLQGAEYRLITGPTVSAVTGLEYRQGGAALEISPVSDSQGRSGRAWTIPVE